ncbi:hypothetical protein [Zestomonas thermotolerans]|nr:hypothetical protein [Pseudomonas thermotolerans]
MTGPPVTLASLGSRAAGRPASSAAVMGGHIAGLIGAPYQHPQLDCLPL